ncbi:MAG: UbiA family prenyltransferase [Candidatus Thermoplasmatota archaeon]|nr:UbiA family prenyltransferase [Candidatus Thermoplasmatota archaeon]
MTARAYVTIIRPGNCLIASGAVAVAGLVAVGYSVLEHAALVNLALACSAVFLFVGAGNTLNDYYDYDVDKVNHPERPIPSGLIARGNALTLAVILFVSTFLLGLLINLESLAVVSISAVVMISYERKTKRKGFLGNLQISWLVGGLFLFGGIAVYDNEAEALLRVTALAALAFLSTLGREITKDIEDLRGDRDRTTLPMSLGPGRSANLARLFYAIAIVLSLVLFFMGTFGLSYLVFVLLADIVFIVSMAFISGNPSLSSNVSKAAMVFALMAFMLGGLGV